MTDTPSPAPAPNGCDGDCNQPNCGCTCVMSERPTAASLASCPVHKHLIPAPPPPATEHIRLLESLSGELDELLSEEFTGIGQSYRRRIVTAILALIDNVSELPLPTLASRAAEVIDVVAAVRSADGRYWVARRSSDGAHAGLAGMWEYPGGKVEDGESLRDALRREMREEFEVGVDVGRKIDSIEARYFEKVYRVHFFAVTFAAEPVRLTCHTEVGWFTPEEMATQQHLPSGAEFNRRLLNARAAEAGSVKRTMWLTNTDSGADRVYEAAEAGEEEIPTSEWLEQHLAALQEIPSRATRLARQMQVGQIRREQHRASFTALQSRLAQLADVEAVQTPAEVAAAPSVFLANLHHFCAQTDGSYTWPKGMVGDLLRQAKREIEANAARVAALEDDCRDAMTAKEGCDRIIALNREVNDAQTATIAKLCAKLETAFTPGAAEEEAR